jgi:hypothetical protein
VPAAVAIRCGLPLVPMSLCVFLKAAHGQSHIWRLDEEIDSQSKSRRAFMRGYLSSINRATYTADDTQLPDGGCGYRFRLNKLTHIRPTNGLLVRKIPDATPEIIARYALTDEQALLAKVRYNRIIDIFLGITASSLLNHLRTNIPNYGQIEIGELCVGLDSRGAQYIVPVQAKGGSDVLGAIQTIQDITFCQTEMKYRDCTLHPPRFGAISRQRHDCAVRDDVRRR